ncbi:hypothetical protein MMC28_006081 [Mycoblastus sanguinarius]|nr:hypothetical protein [Mycoblastus sanguinarius]
MANANNGLPNGLISYGPNENCTLTGPDACPVSTGVYEYRPSIAANAVLLALFGLAMIIHIALGIKWRTWVFTSCIVWGCIAEIIGYGGRIILWQNPFSFTGFLMQIICITLGPVFYTAAIYLTLSKIVIYLGPQHARFSPKLYYWIFIPCDILSLILQAVGGALSSTSSGGSKTAIDVSLAGLSFQVFTLCVFIALAADYTLRYQRSASTKRALPTSFTIFVSFLSLAIILILVRCAYRIDELSDGYNGPLIHDEGLFIGLEGVMIIVSVYCLVIAQPGPVFGLSGFSKADSVAEIKAESEATPV